MDEGISMTDDLDALSRAEKILSQKNSGPSGVLAYMWANTAAGFSKDGSVIQPPQKLNTCVRLRPYYAVVETDRSGIKVTAPPGGTQDVLFNLDGKPQFAELAKPKKQIELIANITGATFDRMDDELFVSHLLFSDRITNVHLEGAFDAAVRETAEEHGWDFEKAKSKSRRVFDVEEELLSKRSFQTDPPTPIKQNVFVVEVDNFDGVIPVHTDKVETKIPSMMGNEFYEKGTFLNFMQIHRRLNDAKTQLAAGGLSEVAEHDYKAAKSRFEMIKRIQSQITGQAPS
jgi:hypothetical protein